MKKTMIAMAVAAAMPVAAQADMTLSGSVSTSFENSTTDAKTLDIDARMSASSTEVLANGMTATATFAVLADTDDDTENAGKVTLSGDFGTLTVSDSIDRDGVYMFGNVGAGNQTSLYETTDSVSTSNAVHYSGEMAGLSIQAQVNASTAADESTAQDSATQIAARYEFNGLTFGYGSTNADMSTDRVTYNATGGTGGTPVGVEGFTQKTISKGSTAGVSYSFGDLTVSYGKESNADDAVMTAKYATTVGAVAVNAMHVDTGAADYTIAGATYSMDALTLALDYSTLKGNSSSKLLDEGTKTSRVSATYVAGNMTTKVGSQWDGAVDVSVALDLGNADLSISRDGSNDADSAAKTSLKYKVSF